MIATDDGANVRPAQLTVRRPWTLFVPLLLLLAACGGETPPAAEAPQSQSSGDLRKVVVQQGGQGFAWVPFLVALERGYFEEEGLELELNIGGGAAETTAAVISGSVDFGNTGTQTILTAAEAGRPVVLVAPLVNQLISGVVVTDETWNEIGGDQLPDVNAKLQAMKGRRFAVQGTGSGTDQLTRYLLRLAGVDPETDITIQSFDTEEAILAAFSGNHIDAFVRSSPATDIAVAEFGGHYLINIGAGDIAELDGIIYTGTVVTPEFAADNEDIVTSYVTALAKGGRVVEECEQAAMEAVRAQLTDVEPELFDAVWKTNYEAFPVSPLSAEEGFEALLRFNEGSTGESFDVAFADVVDNRFAEAALNELVTSNWSPDCDA